MKHRKEIDGLRAVSVLSVLIFHAGFGILPGGFLGVDIFFVISGFLIATQIEESIEAGRFSLADFYERRIRRIVPALSVVIVATLLVCWNLYLPSDMQSLFKSFLATTVFLSNISFLRESGYFDISAELKPLLHTWSLAVEEQFYIVFPLVMAVLSRLRKQWRVSLVTVLGVSSLTWAEVLFRSSPDAVFFLLPSRAWELLVGAIVAIGWRENSWLTRFRESHNIASVIGLVLIVLSLFLFDSASHLPGIGGLLPTVGAALILRFGVQGTAVAMFLSLRGLVAVGKVSYSAYLWHQPVFAIARYMSINGLGNGEKIALLALTACLSWLSWLYVEMPFRNPVFISRARLLRICGLGTGAILVVSACGYESEGFASLRFTQAQLDYISGSSPVRQVCHFQQALSEVRRAACTFGGAPPLLAVVGNSHAAELTFALAKRASARGIGVAQYSMSGCRHNYAIELKGESVCREWHNAVVSSIRSRNEIRYVVLSYRNDNYLSDSLYRRALVRMAVDFIDSGKSVVVVLQAPVLNVDIRRVLPTAIRAMPESIVAGRLLDWHRRYGASAGLLRAQLPKKVSIVDPSAEFCSSGSCFAVRNGVALYFDDNHMSLAGASLVAAEIMRNVPKK